MDILAKLSELLFQDSIEYDGKIPEYVELIKLEGHILGEITEKSGEDLVEKLMDVQNKIMHCNQMSCFLYGLRLGVELLHRNNGFLF